MTADAAEGEKNRKKRNSGPPMPSSLRKVCWVKTRKEGKRDLKATFGKEIRKERKGGATGIKMEMELRRAIS